MLAQDLADIFREDREVLRAAEGDGEAGVPGKVAGEGDVVAQQRLRAGSHVESRPHRSGAQRLLLVLPVEAEPRLADQGRAERVSHR